MFQWTQLHGWVGFVSPSLATECSIILWGLKEWPLKILPQAQLKCITLIQITVSEKEFLYRAKALGRNSFSWTVTCMRVIYIISTLKTSALELIFVLNSCNIYYVFILNGDFVTRVLWETKRQRLGQASIWAKPKTLESLKSVIPTNNNVQEKILVNHTANSNVPWKCTKFRIGKER